MKGKPVPTKPTYETPAERAERQILIVRQSMVKAAIDFVNGQQQEVGVSEVLKIAQQFEAYVLSLGSVADMENDIPE